MIGYRAARTPALIAAAAPRPSPATIRNGQIAASRASSADDPSSAPIVDDDDFERTPVGLGEDRLERLAHAAGAVVHRHDEADAGGGPSTHAIISAYICSSCARYHVAAIGAL